MQKPFQYLTPCELADRWRVTESALGKWRAAGIGPRFIKFGPRNAPVRYPMDDILKFERDNTFEPIRVNYRKPD